MNEGLSNLMLDECGNRSDCNNNDNNDQADASDVDLNEDQIYNELVDYGITVDIEVHSGYCYTHSLPNSSTDIQQTQHAHNHRTPLEIDVSLTCMQDREPSIQKHAYLAATTSKAELIVAGCKFCSINQINTIINPCMHACLCVDCAKNYAGLCPLCFALIKHIDNMFLNYDEVDIECNPKRRKNEFSGPM
jgi:hypothetical protein